MIEFEKINQFYLKDLVSFLHSIKWIFSVVNTQFIKENVIAENRVFLESFSEFSSIDANTLPELKQRSNDSNSSPECLQNLIDRINEFKLIFQTINTDYNKLTPVKRMSVKKQYEIEAVSEVIQFVCKDEAYVELVDFGSGLGYLGHHLAEKYGYRILGLEGSSDRVAKARERQIKHHESSIDKVKHTQHFITLDSENFILKEVSNDYSPLVIFGLHGCGDLTVVAIKLFLTMSRVSKLIFMPCCYHKMSKKNVDQEEFRYFPLSNELQEILKNYPKFLNRAFLRLAGQESPDKWKDMSESDHWIHGKNMFERAVVEALLDENQTIKRVNNIVFPENRVTMNDITVKYQVYNNENRETVDWSEKHFQKFKSLREKYPDGEELSEKLFYLQTMIQNNCENLVTVDRIKFIQEQAEKEKLNLKISIKKLQNDKLSPRCLVIIVEK